MTTLNYSAPKNELRLALKSMMTEINNNTVIFKKTAKKFFAENEINLANAPVVIVKNGIYYHLNHTSYKGYKGRKIENAWYAPIVDVQEEIVYA